MAAQETFGANFFETTVTTQVGPTDLTANVVATSGLAAPCYVVFDPDVPARREIWLVDQSIGATTLVASNINKRYLTGSAAGSGITHPVGSVVRCGPVFQHFTDINDRVDALDTEKSDLAHTHSEPEIIVVAISDESTAITTGNAKVTFRMPYAMTVTAVRASLSTASSSGTPTFDINEGGTSILSTKLTIDANEKTSTTAAAAAVISDSALADDAEITIDVDVAGTGAKGAKVYLIGTRA